jgi:hypothetical protein
LVLSAQKGLPVFRGEDEMHVDFSKRLGHWSQAVV